MILDAFAAVIPRRRAGRPDVLDDFWYQPAGAPTFTGITVRPDNALAVATVFACIRVLAETFASLPCRVYRRLDARSKEPDQESPLWRTLHDQPNPWQTSFEWREMAMAHLCLRGNFYCRIYPAIEGGIDLYPLNPDSVTAEQLPDGAIRYKHRRPDGGQESLSQYEVLHVRGLSLNGFTGISILEFARQAVGLGIAQEQHGASLFKNGALPAFWIKRPPGRKWDKSAIENFRAGWRKLHAGAENAGNPPILEDGMELMQLGLTNSDSQWLESRKFQADEIVRFFRVPPHLVGILDKATFSNIEQQSIEFVTYTMTPWCVRFEQAVQRDLIEDPEESFVKLALEGLLRGDIASRYAAYNVGLQAGFLLRNEVRELEDLNPIPGGDTPLEALNMVPAGSRDAEPPEPPEDEEPDADEEDEEESMPPGGDRQRAMATLIEDAAARIASAEIRAVEGRIDKAADRQRWCDWLAEFYPAHAKYIEKALTPLATAWRALGGDYPDVAAVCREHCRRGFSLFAGPDPAGAVAGWKTTLAADTAAAINAAFGIEVTP